VQQDWQTIQKIQALLTPISADQHVNREHG